MIDDVLEDAAPFACERQVFGRAIGKYQGVAPAFANAATDVEAARLLGWHAIAARAEGLPRCRLAECAGVLVGRRAWLAADRIIFN